MNHREQNKVLHRALWLASLELHNRGGECPNPEHCCDVQMSCESFIRQAERQGDAKYGEKTMEEILVEMRSAPKESE